MGIGLLAGAVAIGAACAAFGVPVEFALFGLTLTGVALLHHRVLQVALTGFKAGPRRLYVIGFIVMLALVGWHPAEKRGRALMGESPPVAGKVVPADT